MLFSSLSRAASMTINPALTTLLFLFRSLARPRRNRRAKSSKSFHSFHEVSTLIVCKAMRMHGHVSQIDKCCPPECITATQVPYTHVYPPTSTQIYLFLIMSSHSQTTGGPSSDDESRPILIFELNQARRAKVVRELDAFRTGM